MYPSDIVEEERIHTITLLLHNFIFSSGINGSIAKTSIGTSSRNFSYKSPAPLGKVIIGIFGKASFKFFIIFFVGSITK